MTKTQPLMVGSPEARGDARAKATGEERFAADCYPDNLIWAGAVRAGISHGRLQSVDFSTALTVPGVLKVLTSKDVPGPNRHGIIHKDMPVLADDRILYPGDAVALVLAESRDALRLAMKQVRVTIQPLPGVFD
ncbi:MAG: xanthine dehydrogenase family protein molybdopterin-binding subunit, partial [Desulfobulbus sp.]|nr:xanthine dehydrogenase family protein molybdopterin-binding subunit [Desulfobulbus sp.]